MTIEQFDKHHQARPFKPFRMFLSDGRSFLIEHAEYVARSPNGRTVGLFDIEDGALEAVDLLHVTSLKLNGSVAVAPPGNGSNGLTSERGPDLA